MAELCAPRAKACGAGETPEQEPHGHGRPLLKRLPAHRDQHDRGRDGENRCRERETANASHAQRAERPQAGENERAQLREPQPEQEPAARVRREPVRRLGHDRPSSEPSDGRAGRGARESDRVPRSDGLRAPTGRPPGPWAADVPAPVRALLSLAVNWRTAAPAGSFGAPLCWDRAPLSLSRSALRAGLAPLLAPGRCDA